MSAEHPFDFWVRTLVWLREHAAGNPSCAASIPPVERLVAELRAELLAKWRAVS